VEREILEEALDGGQPQVAAVGAVSPALDGVLQVLQESENSLGCKQDSTGSYTYTFDLTNSNGSIQVRFGSVDGNINGARVRNMAVSPNIAVFSSIGASFPSPSSQLYWYYDADLNYSQIDVNLNRKIVLGRA